MRPILWLLLTGLGSALACTPAPGPQQRPAGGDSVPGATSFRVPPDGEIPAGPMGASIRRGRALFAATRDSLPEHVGNDLRCTSCHLDDGTRPYAAPWVGVYSRFPQYRSRNAKVNVVQDRINDCIQRSLGGRPLPEGGRDMADMIAYLAFLSRGVAPPGEVPGQGFQTLQPMVGDTVRGARVYLAQCARCHGGQGQGMANPDPSGHPGYYPPLWGPRSFTIGAGMARVRTAAAFIHANMPFDRPGTLSEQEAFDVAAYMTSRPRPDFPAKVDDWPLGDPPADVAYRTRAAPDRGAIVPLLPPPVVGNRAP